jgi:hypothetical protein
MLEASSSFFLDFTLLVSCSSPDPRFASSLSLFLEYLGPMTDLRFHCIPFLSLTILCLALHLRFVLSIPPFLRLLLLLRHGSTLYNLLHLCCLYDL